MDPFHRLRWCVSTVINIVNLAKFLIFSNCMYIYNIKYIKLVNTAAGGSNSKYDIAFRHGHRNAIVNSLFCF